MQLRELNILSPELHEIYCPRNSTGTPLRNSSLSPELSMISSRTMWI